MKKIFCFAIAIAMMPSLFTSCSGSGTNAGEGDSVSIKEQVEAVVDSTEADSIALLLGSLLGNDRAHSFIELEGDSVVASIDRKEFLKGVKVAVNDNNTSKSFTMGVQAAHELLLKFKDFDNYNVKINREILLAAIEKQLRADSVSDSTLTEANTAYNELLQRIYKADL